MGESEGDKQLRSSRLAQSIVGAGFVASLLMLVGLYADALHGTGLAVLVERPWVDVLRLSPVVGVAFIAAEGLWLARTRRLRTFAKELPGAALALALVYVTLFLFTVALGLTPLRRAIQGEHHGGGDVTLGPAGDALDWLGWWFWAPLACTPLALAVTLFFGPRLKGAFRISREAIVSCVLLPLLLLSGMMVGTNVMIGGRPALTQAVADGDDARVRRLLASGANPNDKPYSTALGPLHYAAARGDVGLIEALLKAGARPDDVSALHGRALDIAITAGHVGAARALIRGGASVAVGDRYSPVANAALERNLPLVNLLIEAGADVNAIDGWQQAPPLVIAAQYGYDEIAGRLLAANARPDGRDADGVTALMCAATRDDVPLAHMLLDSGADASLADRHGRTARQHCQRTECAVATLLER